MKKTVKRAVALALSATLVFSLATGCQNKKKAKYNIGICQLVQHDALNAATEGFKKALEDKLGDDVSFDVQNAQGDSVNCVTIMGSFTAAKKDLILANATPALQAAHNATATIPILGTSVTDYGAALDMTIKDGKTGINISGTSDLAPLDKQAELFKTLLPDAKKVGILYCSAEANSKFQAVEIAKELKKLGIETKDYVFTDSNDIAAVCTSAVSNCDALYIPTDNTAASNKQLIDSIARPKKCPIIAGEVSICMGCGIATVSIDYYDLGYETGLMAYDILVNKKDIKTMEIKYSPKVTYQYNETICKELNIKVPDNFEVAK